MEFTGYSYDKKTIYIDLVEGEHKFLWIATIYLDDKCYFVLESSMKSEIIDEGSFFVFEFKGNMETLSGNYILVDNDETLDRVYDELDKLIEEEKEKKQKDQVQSNNKNKMRANFDKGRVFEILRNFCYILGIGYCVFSFIAFILASVTGNESYIYFTPSCVYSIIIYIFPILDSGGFLSFLSSIIYLVLFFVPIMGIISSIISLKRSRNSEDTMHKTTTVIGVFCLNPFIIFAGGFNSLAIKAKYKIYPKNE